MRNLGPVCLGELQSLGIHPARDLPKADWREVAGQWMEAYPERMNLNALRVLIGAITDRDWRDIDAADLRDARVWLAAMRRAAGRPQRTAKKKRSKSHESLCDSEAE